MIPHESQSDDLERTAVPADSVPQNLTQSMVLLSQARDGSDAALNELLQRYYERVTRVARIRTGPALLAWMDWDDIVQEAFLRASQCITEIEAKSPSSIIQWLAMVVENVIRDKATYIKAEKRSRQKEVPFEYGDTRQPGLGDVLEGHDTTPSDRVKRAELKSIYDSCVAQLDDREREVILLRNYAEADWQEIAERLDRPSEAAARELYRRARARLSQRLKARLR